MALNELGRLTIASDTQANVEAGTAALQEIRFAKRTSDNCLGFYIGGTWYWVDLTTLGPTAGGDLSGSYPNPTVAKVNGNTPGVAAVAHQFVTAIDSSGRGTLAQPAYSDLTGTPVAGSGELLVLEGSSAPPVTLTNEAEDDWVYEG